MCGIVGYIGRRQAAPILLDSLSRLEYRGYDSAGLAVRNGTALAEVVKATGKLYHLADKTDQGRALEGCCGIGHTRWATHGDPSVVNAHPHVSGNCSGSGSGAVESDVVGVHNGIIENYTELREKLLRHGYVFYSDTDTEVAVKLVDYYYKKYKIGPVDAITRTMVRIRGSYALALMFKDFHGDDVRNDFFRQDFFTGRTIFMTGCVMAVGRVFRHGDAEHAAQSFSLAEQTFHGAFQPLERFGGMGGADGLGMVRRYVDPAPVRFLLIETQRHAAGLVQVKIDFDAVFGAAADDFFQIFHPFFRADGIFFRAGDRIQQIQQGMHPDAFDSHGGILREQVFRDGIEGFGVAEHIAAAGGIGMDVIEIEAVFALDRRTRRELVGKSKRRFQIFHPVGGEIFPQGLTQDPCSFLLFRGQRFEFQHGAVRFDFADFGPEEIFFLEGVSHLFRSPVQQFEQLGIREQLPVVLDQGQITVGDPFRIDLRIRNESHSGGGVQNVVFGTAEHGGDPGGGNEFPVPPDERLPAGWKMGIFNRRFRIAGRQVFCFHMTRFLCCLLQITF